MMSTPVNEERVVATIIALAGSHDVVRTALTDLVAATRTEEGCVSYELFESAASAGTFITVETWRSAADLAEHMTTPHIAAALAAVDGHLAQPPGIHPLTHVA